MSTPIALPSTMPTQWNTRRSTSRAKSVRGHLRSERQITMKPSFPRVLSAVPQTLHVQLEIAKAIRTLAGPDEDELLQQRRAEIAALRRDLDALIRGVRKLGEELPSLVMVELQSELKKYSPDQPRVSAGNRDGGQWTSGSKAGDDATPLRTQHTALDTGSRIDITGSTASTVTSAPRQAQVVPPAQPAGNIAGSGKAPIRISAYDIPADSPARPVAVVDSHGEPILDAEGNPLLRPDDKPPEMFVREGLAARSAFFGLTRLGAVSLAVAMFVERAAEFGQGGPWDAQRINGQNVDEYRDYATIAIGLYMAAALVPIEIALLVENEYARGHSEFDRDEPKDAVYTYLPKRNVRNTEIGYELYRSGRISAPH
jgi:hypothetical protein